MHDAPKASKKAAGLNSGNKLGNKIMATKMFLEHIRGMIGYTQWRKHIPLPIGQNAADAVAASLCQGKCFCHCV